MLSLPSQTEQSEQKDLQSVGEWINTRKTWEFNPCFIYLQDMRDHLSIHKCVSLEICENFS
jgi:hypothetical protein